MTAHSQANSFQVFLSALRTGESEAWSAAYERYFGRLIALARSKLDARLRPKVGLSEVAQSVFVGLGKALNNLGTDKRPRDWHQLWGLLARMTVFRCCKWYRDFITGKRDVRKEVAVDAIPERDLAERDPDPQEVAELLETVERGLDGWDERDREIVRLVLLGYDDEEIGERLECSEDEVREVFAAYAGRLGTMAERAVEKAAAEEADTPGSQGCG